METTDILLLVAAVYGGVTLLLTAGLVALVLWDRAQPDGPAPSEPPSPASHSSGTVVAAALLRADAAPGEPGRPGQQRPGRPGSNSMR